MPGDEGTTLFGRPVDRRTLLTMTGKVLAGGTVAGLWLSPELAHYVHATARGEAPGGSITVMKQLSNPGTPGQWATFFNAFTKETGIRINPDNQNYDNQYQKIATQGQAGTAGDDVVEIDTIWTGSFAAANFTSDLSDFLPASTRKKIIGPSLASVGYKGKLYGVPEYNSSKHFFYNKKMLDSVGLKQPPSTLNDLLHYCDVLKANKSRLGIQYPMSWSWKQAEALTCDYVQMTDSLGGRFYAPDNVTPLFNKGAGVQAATMMKMMLDKGYVSPGSLSKTENDVENDLLAGKIAMSTNWEGTMADSLNAKLASKNILGQIRMSLIPGSPGRKSGSCLGPEGWAIMKASPNQVQAKAFLNWWITARSQISMTENFDIFPVYSSLYSDPTLRALLKKGDGQDTFPTYGEQFAYAQARPNFPGYLAASQRLQVHLHKIFLGQETPQKGLDSAAQEMSAGGSSGNNP